MSTKTPPHIILPPHTHTHQSKIQHPFPSAGTVAGARHTGVQIENTTFHWQIHPLPLILHDLHTPVTQF